MLTSAQDAARARARSERAARRRAQAALRRARAARAGRLLRASSSRARAGGARGRRGALHQPLGPRLPPRVPPARRAAARCARRRRPGLHRHRDARGARRRRARSSGCATRSCSSAASTGRTSPTASCRGATWWPGARGRSRRHRGRGRHRLLPAPRATSRSWRAELARAGVRCAPYHAGLDGRRARASTRSAFLQRGARRRRRDRRVRHGHRPLRRALRRARQPAQGHRAVQPGDGPRRPRRAAGRVRAVLLGRRLPRLEVADRAQRAGGGRERRRERGRRPGRRAAAAERDVRLRDRRELPPPPARRALRPALDAAPEASAGAARATSAWARCTVVDGAIVVAQKILSCVVRCGQRFGAGHVADVLRGADTERIRRTGHDRLSTFGLLGRALSARHPRTGSTSSSASATCASPAGATRRSPVTASGVEVHARASAR